MVSKFLRKVISLIERLKPFEQQARNAGVQLGNNNFIASHFWSSEPYLIKIGSYCGITAGVKIFTHGGGHAIRNIYPKFDVFGKVTVGDYVYIGNNSLIMPGVTIGNNVLIAAGSVVTKSIPDNCVVGGNPATFICTINEYVQRNLPYNLNSKGMDSISKKTLLQTIDESKFVTKKVIRVQK